MTGPACRFEPTCSEYAHQALAVHGLGRGLYLTLRRLLRCRPMGGCGYDPVPRGSGAKPATFLKEQFGQSRQIVIFVLLVVAAIFYADIVRWIRPPKAPIGNRCAAGRMPVVAAATASVRPGARFTAERAVSPMSTAGSTEQLTGGMPNLSR